MTEKSDFRFHHLIQVRYADIDGQGHVFFGNYFTYFDEACTYYLTAIGFPWQKLPEMGLDFFYVDAQCQFKGAARFQDILQVYTRIARIGNTSLTLECAIYSQDTEALIAAGKITIVIVDPKTRQPVRVPDELRQTIASFDDLQEADQT